MYKRKEFVEKPFDVLKNELEEKRLRVRSSATMEGKIFIVYLALILYSALNKKTKEKNLYQRWSIPQILYELKKLRIVELENGKMFLTEMTIYIKRTPCTSKFYTKLF